MSFCYLQIPTVQLYAYARYNFAEMGGPAKMPAVQGNHFVGSRRPGHRSRYWAIVNVFKYIGTFLHTGNV
jgi:hypothetical protein